MPGEVLGCASLREEKISKDERPTSIVQLAVPASQAPSLSLCGVLFILSKRHMSSTGLASAHASNQPESTEAARNTCTPKNKSESHAYFYWFLQRAASLDLRPVGHCQGCQGDLTAPPWRFLMILCRQAASGGGDWLDGVAALGRDEVMVKVSRI